jgi:hypothetical protein
LPTDRSVGLVFAAATFIVAYIWRRDLTVAYSALSVAGMLVVVSLIVPIALRPLNIVWMKFALLLNRIMSPIIMGILFVAVIAPVGLIMQTRLDPLRKRRRGNETTYWIVCNKPETPPSMVNQF